MKRFIAVFLTLCLVLGMSSVSTFATETSEWKEEKPISTALCTTSSVSTGGKIYVMGGQNGKASTKAMFSIDKDGNWKSETPMPENAVSAVATVGDKIYIFGGKSAKTTSTNKVYI